MAHEERSLGAAFLYEVAAAWAVVTGVFAVIAAERAEALELICVASVARATGSVPATVSAALSPLRSVMALWLTLVWFVTAVVRVVRSAMICFSMFVRKLMMRSSLRLTSNSSCLSTKGMLERLLRGGSRVRRRGLGLRERGRLRRLRLGIRERRAHLGTSTTS